MDISEALYRSLFIRRYDDEGYIKYFSAADFPELTDEPFRFVSGENTLSGHKYTCAGTNGDLIVFCHGIGGGHRSYMKEIALICRRGYTVLAYDNTGCFESEGENIKSFAQSLADLDAAVTHLRAQNAFAPYRHVYAMGHSWGGYAVANLPAYQTVFEKIAVISGFISVERLLLGKLNGARDPVRRRMLERLFEDERRACPGYADACALDAVNAGTAKYLFAHSTDDKTVAYDYNTGYIKENATVNAQYLIYNDRNHNPNYTPDAVQYLNETFDGFNKKFYTGRMRSLEAKQAYFADADWDRMTAQDEDFWAKVFAFLEE